jgi:peptidoglycan/LPS O-acetylase OafA/YrhL
MATIRHQSYRDAVPTEGASVPGSTGGYVTMLDFFRVVVCIAVVAQHSLLWTDMSDNVAGTAFVTILHFTRDAFFFLSALVICVAQRSRPRTVRNFWLRRYRQIGVPFLAWTAIYVAFTTLRPGGSWHHIGSVLGVDLVDGYYQLYVVIVLFQLYLVFPLLMRLLSATRRHGAIMAVSIAFALLLGLELHFSWNLGFLSDAVRHVGSIWPWSRSLLSYQEFFVAGALAGWHLDELLAFVHRRQRQILMLSGVVGGIALAWYFVSIWLGATTSAASDIYQPIAVAWSFAAVAGLICLSMSWARTSRRRRRRQLQPTIPYLAGLTGGVYFCHVLFINLVRAVLERVGLFDTLPWPVIVLILFVGTITLAAAFTALVLRTPLRWVLGGPVRSEQREGAACCLTPVPEGITPR